MRYLAGIPVQRAGVYNVVHNTHRPAHMAVLQAGECFPECRRCGTAVGFEFSRAVSESDETEHIGYDYDFMDSVLRKFAKAS